MITHRRRCWILFLLAAIGRCESFTVPADMEKAKEIQSSDVLRGLSRAFIYLIEHSEDADVGAYFGVVLAKAQLEGTDDEDVKKLADILIQRGFTMDYPLGPNLNNVVRHIFDPRKWTKIGRAVSESLVCKEGQTGLKLPKKQFSLRNSPNETESDMCLSQLVDMADMKKKASNEIPFHCEMSKECKAILTGGFPTGYALTHRVLYFLVAESEGCMKMSVEAMCCGIQKEILILESNGFPLQFRDLFMEQVFVCAMSGYGGFLSDRRLRRVLDWQKEGGCWGTEGEEDSTPFRSGYAGKRGRAAFKSPGGEGCSSHMTGVGVALLAAAIKHREHVRADAKLPLQY